MFSSSLTIVMLIVVCFFVFRIEYAIRAHAIWSRRVEIDKAVGAFAKAKRNFPTAFSALSEGVLPDGTQECVDYRHLVAVWENAVSILYVSMKQGDLYQVFSRRLPDEFNDYATSRFHSLLDNALATMQNELTANAVFHGPLTIDADLLKYVHLYLKHQRPSGEQALDNA